MIFNMVGGGDPDKSGIILNNSQVKPNVPYAFVSIGAASLNASPFDGVSLEGLANNSQYAYIRLGPVDLTNIASIDAVISATRSGSQEATTTTRTVLFVSQNANDRSWSETATAEVVSRSSNQTRTAINLDTSSLTGQYYVYAGTDTNNALKYDKRVAVVYGVQLNKGA